jgi:hypothetical protein
MERLYPPAEIRKGLGGLSEIVPVLARIRTDIVGDEAYAGEFDGWGLAAALDSFLRANASALLLLQNPGAPDALETYAPTWPKLETFWKLFLKEAGPLMVLAGADAIARDKAMAELIAGRATATDAGVILSDA